MPADSAPPPGSALDTHTYCVPLPCVVCVSCALVPRAFRGGLFAFCFTRPQFTWPMVRRKAILGRPICGCPIWDLLYVSAPV
eukprot:5610204-Prymnesium_polylepis.1